MDNFIEISTLQTPFFELSEKAVNGRRQVKFVCLEIHQDVTNHNQNGITWVEEFVRRNIDTAINMSITAALIDGEIPTDHGFLEIQDRMPIFNASVIGHTYDAKIEELLVNGRSIKALVGYGLLDQMRFPKLISWIETQIANRNPVSGSIEISSVVPGEPIGYANGYKDLGRQPEIFCFSGFSLITAEPADPSSLLIEMNTKVKEEIKMDKDFENAFDSISSKLEALNSLEAKFAEINTVKGDLATKIAECNQLQTSLDDANKKIADLQAQVGDCDKKMKELEAQTKKAELNAAIKDFSEADLAPVKDLIDKFNADPKSVEINTIVQKLKAAKYDSLMAEINAKRESKKDTDVDLMFVSTRRPLDNSDYTDIF